jgi:hypothetical protein
MSSFLFFVLLFTTTIDLWLMGTSPDEDLTSYVHVAHGLKSLVRPTISNPNKRFMLMGEDVAAGEPNAENPDLNNEPVVKEEGEEEVNEGIDEDDEDDEIDALVRYIRSDRSIKRPDRLMQ